MAEKNDTRYKICWGDFRCPGHGGGDSDFYTEETYIGSFEEAEKLAEKDYYGRFMTDFSYRINPRSLLITTLSGPSCASKSIILLGIEKYRKHKPWEEESDYIYVPAIRNKADRPEGPRPEEIPFWNYPDYFLEDSEFRNLDQEKYLLVDCRGKTQALNLDKILSSNEDRVVLEVFHKFAEQLPRRLEKRATFPNYNISSVFLTPFSYDMLDSLSFNERESYIVETMSKKLSSRTRFQNQVSCIGDILTDSDKKDIEKRSRYAYEELKLAHSFNHILFNPYTEDDRDAWGMSAKLKKDSAFLDIGPDSQEMQIIEKERIVLDIKPNSQAMQIINDFSQLMSGEVPESVKKETLKWRTRNPLN